MGTFKQGEKIQAYFRGDSTLYPGIIDRCNRDGTYDIKYDDGDFETKVPFKLIKRGDSSSTGHDIQNYQAGESISAYYQNGDTPYTGRIVNVTQRGNTVMYSIKYDDGDFEENVPARLIRRLANTEGSSLSTGDIVNTLKQVIATAQSKGVDIRECFEHFDDNFDGVIEPNELQRGVKDLGLELNQQQLQQLVSRFGDKNGMIKYADFLNMLFTSKQDTSIAVAEEELKRLCECILKANDQGFSFKESFKYFDTDGSGVIDRREFYEGLGKLGVEVDRKQARLLMRYFEDPSTRVIRYKPFVDKVVAYIEQSQTKDTKSTDLLISQLKSLIATAQSKGVDIRECFEHFDDNFDGVIEPNELQRGVKDLGLELNQQQLQQLVSRFGDKNGMIRYADFLNMLFTSKQDTSISVAEEELKRLCECISKANDQGFSFKESFKYFDTDGSGVIDRREFYEGLGKLGVEVDRKQARLLMRYFEDPSTGVIRYKPFVDKVVAYIEQSQTKDTKSTDLLISQLKSLIATAQSKGVDIRECFEHFDDNFDGVIEPNELQRGVKDLGLELNQQQLQQLVSRFGDKNGMIKYADFLNMLFTSKQDTSIAVAEEELKRLCECILKANDQGFSFKESFKYFDTDGSGVIDRREFYEGLGKLGVEVDRKQARLLMRYFEDPSTRVIRYKPFVDKVVAYIEQSQTKDTKSTDLLISQLKSLIATAQSKGVDIRECFEHFDDNFDGVIEPNELQRGVKDLGLELNQQQLQQLVSRFGDKNGMIKYADFLNMLFTSKQDTSISVAEEELKRLCECISKANDQGFSFKESFKYFDTDGSGVIDRREFYEGLGKLGVEVDRKQARLLMRYFEDPSTGVIRYKPFVDKVVAYIEQCQTKDTKSTDLLISQLKSLIATAQSKGVDIRECFEHFDDNFDGVIEPNELQRGVKDLGLELNQQQLQQLVSRFGDKNGMIKYADFLNMLFTSKQDTSISVAEEELKRLCECISKANDQGFSFKESFKYFDTDESGVIDRREFYEGLGKLGVEVDRKQARLLMRYFEDPSTGVIRYKPFVDKVVAYIEQSQTKDTKSTDLLISQLKSLIATAQSKGVDIRECFEHFDDNFDGVIEPNELQRGVKDLGLELNQQQLQQLVSRFGDKNGMIKYADFLNMLFTSKQDASIAVAEEELKRLCECILKANDQGFSFKESFKYFDTDGSGVIDRREFYEGLGKLGVEVDRKQARLLMRYFEDPSTGIIRYKPFVDKIYHFLNEYGDNVQELLDRLRSLVETAQNKGLNFREVFAHFDRDADGTITAEELGNGFKSLGMHLNVQQLNRLRLKFGDKQGRIAYRDFLRVLSPVRKGRDANSVSRTILRIQSQLQQIKLGWQKLREKLQNTAVGDMSLVTNVSLEAALKGLGIRVSSQSITDVLEVFLDKSDSLSADVESLIEFLQSFSSGDSISELLEHLRSIFQKAQLNGLSLRDCFAHFDPDYVGEVSFRDFFRGLQQLGVRVNRDVAKQIQGYFERDGTLQYDEFISWVGMSGGSLREVTAQRFVNVGLLLHGTEPHRICQFLSNAFRSKDSTGYGEVTRSDLRRVLRSLRIEADKHSMQAIFARFDSDGLGTVNYEEFAAWVAEATDDFPCDSIAAIINQVCAKQIDDAGAITRQFEFFDINMDGLITKKELLSGVLALGIQLSEAQEELLQQFLEVPGSAKVQYTVFLRLLLSKLKDGTSLGPEIGAGPVGHQVTEAVVADLQDFVSLAKSMGIPLGETFRCFDRDADGTISWKEFVSTMVELGFECSESSLKRVMRSMDINRDGRVRYHEFIHFWSKEESQREVEVASRASKSPRPGTNAAQNLEFQLSNLTRQLHRCVVETKRRGESVAKLFSKFDRDGNGFVSAKEFEITLREMGVKFSSKVFRAFLRQFDTNQDNRIDYCEFLGIRSVPATWSATFSQQRTKQRKIKAVAFARSLVWSVVRRTELEIKKKGPIWKEITSKNKKQLEHRTFVLKNKFRLTKQDSLKGNMNLNQEHFHAVVADGSQHELPVLQPSDPTDKTPRSAVNSSSHPKRALKVAERLVEAEQAAAQLSLSEALDNEAKARMKARELALNRAQESALAAIKSRVQFSGIEESFEFLQACGLEHAFRSSHQDGEFSSSHQVGDGTEYPVVFVIGKNTATSDPAPSRQSNIIARRLRRELISYLEPCRLPVRAGQSIETWSVADVISFAHKIKVPAEHLEDLGVDGEALLQLTEDEMEMELGLVQISLRQRLMYQIAFHEALRGVPQAVFRPNARNQSTQAHMALKAGDEYLFRPSPRPVHQWSEHQVEQFLATVGVQTASLAVLKLDGQGLVELSSDDLENELGLDRDAARIVLEAVHEARQPAHLVLGSGAYMELRTDAGAVNMRAIWEEDRPSGDVQIAISPDQNVKLWVKAQNPLQHALRVAARAVQESQRNALGSIKDVEFQKSQLVALNKMGNDNSRRVRNDVFDEVYRFLAHARHSGIDVEQVFRQCQRETNSNQQSRIETNESGASPHLLLDITCFENAMLQLGWDPKEKSKLTFMFARVPFTNGGEMDATTLLSLARAHSQMHNLTFDASKCGSSVSLTVDGQYASVLETSVSRTSNDTQASMTPGSKVMVRHNGGNQLYEGEILSDNKDGTFAIRFTEGSEEVRRMPLSWIKPKECTKRIGNKLTTEAVLNTQVNVACARKQFERGVHSWLVQVIHVSRSTTIGVLWTHLATLGSERKQRLVGLNSSGRVAGIGAQLQLDKTNNMESHQTSPLSAGDIIRVQVNLDVFNISFSVNSGEPIGPFSLLSEEQKQFVNTTSQLSQFYRQVKSHYNVDLQGECMKHDNVKSGCIGFERLFSILSNFGCEVTKSTLLSHLQLGDFLQLPGERVRIARFFESLKGFGKQTSCAQPAVLLEGKGSSVCFLPLNSFPQTHQTNTSTEEAMSFRESPGCLNVGSSVLVRYAGGHSTYPAKISKVNFNAMQHTEFTPQVASYDIEYLDGGTERNVLPINVSLCPDVHNNLMPTVSAKNNHETSSTKTDGPTVELRVYCRILQKSSIKKKLFGNKAVSVIADQIGKSTEHNSRRRRAALAAVSSQSFCDAGGVLVQDLLRKYSASYRTCTHDLDACNVTCPVAPRVVRGGRQPVKAGQTRLEGWKLVGVIDSSKLSPPDAQGIGLDLPFSLSIPAMAVPESGKSSSYRVCVMGIVGVVDVEGNFKPRKSVVRLADQSVGDEYAAHFFLLSNCFVAMKRTGRKCAKYNSEKVARHGRTNETHFDSARTEESTPPASHREWGGRHHCTNSKSTTYRTTNNRRGIRKNLKQQTKHTKQSFPSPIRSPNSDNGRKREKQSPKHPYRSPTSKTEISDKRGMVAELRAMKKSMQQQQHQQEIGTGRETQLQQSIRDVDATEAQLFQLRDKFSENS